MPSLIEGHTLWPGMLVVVIAAIAGTPLFVWIVVNMRRSLAS